MRIFYCLFVSLISSVQSYAQITFSATNLPSQIAADYTRAYVNTNEIDVSNVIGPAGGPQRWDFSQPKVAAEFIQRMDVVSVNDGGQGASFPEAAFAERRTRESNGARNWEYYRIVTNEGRHYYGFYDANANSDCPLKVFQLPTIDLPDGIHFGQTWDRATDFDDCADIGFFIIDLAVHFTSHGDADAFGTLLLPCIGEVPALRLKEINTYEVTDVSLGLFDSTSYFTNYSWLVRGVGRAVQIIIPGPTESFVNLPPSPKVNDLRTPLSPNTVIAKTVLRVFEANNVADRLRPRLTIRLQGGHTILDWAGMTNCSGYRLEYSDNLSQTNWQTAADISTNSWTDPMAATQATKFFRLLLKP